MPHELLLADDSVTIQRVIELTFADEDVDVIAVGDGQQAIQRVQSERPDIVLADIGMPERDGYEVAAFIKGTSSSSVDEYFDRLGTLVEELAGWNPEAADTSLPPHRLIRRRRIRRAR